MVHSTARTGIEIITGPKNACLSQRQAFRVFGFVRGDTDPELLKNRGVGLSLRRRWLRDWLFVELEPRYEWRKRRVEEEREGVVAVRLRLEILIGER